MTRNARRPTVPGVTIYSRGKTFAFLVELPADPVTGQRRREYKGGFATDEDAWADAVRVKAALDENRRVPPSKLTVKKFFDEWTATVAPSLKPSSRANYNDYLSAYVLPHIGARRLQELSVQTLNALYRRLLEAGRCKQDTNSVMYEFWKQRVELGAEPSFREIAASCGTSIHAARSAILRYRRGRIPESTGKGLAPKTVKNVHRLLHRALQDAVAWQYLSQNPAVHASLPRERRRHAKTGATWTPDELRQWLAVAVEEPDAALWVLEASTGMRRSELAGLTRDQVDVDRRTLTIADTRVVVSGRAEASDGKTASSVRTIALDDVSARYLSNQFARLDENRREFGESYEPRGFVFCHPDGSPIHPDTITRRHNRLVDKAGVPRIRFHDIRHSYATIMLDSGVPLKIVSERLGHASVIVTGQIYTHRSTGNDVAAAAAFANLIFKPAPEA